MESRYLSRGKTDDGRWVQGAALWHDDLVTIFNQHPADGTLQGFEVDPESVCRCTGITDNNKQLIFEKDVVEFVLSPASSEKYLLWWNNEMQCMTAVDMGNIYSNGYDYSDGNPNFSYDTFCLMMQDPYGDFRDIKVVGNIIDNPELLSELNREDDYNMNR